MCGIAGIVSKRADRNVDAALLAEMNRVLRHRGPDDGDQYVTPPGGPLQAGIAMRRLSVIDLTTGHQPIANEDGTVRIVFNGEIYNHAALRSELEALGHRFTTRSDTEAILHAYEEWGAGCLGRLRGMFAFLIADERAGQFFAARDPVGIKPLFWTERPDRILFASEIKSLLRDPTVPRRVDVEGLHDYLTYLYTPAPGTLFKGIRQLPPGHFLMVRDGALHVEEYWRGPEALLNGDAGPPIDPSEVWTALRESVDAHLLSDVPVGAFLSGGLDSSLVVALMSELSPHPVRTFSIGFSSAGLYNELPHARSIARHFKTEHHEADVRADAVNLLPEIIRHLDEPLADASVIPNYLVAQLARKHVTVALTGIGGDELFGGYRRYFGDTMARRWKRVPRPVRNRVLLPALRMVPASGDTALGDASRLIQKFLEPLDLSPEDRYLAWNAHFSEAAKRALYAPATPDRKPSAERMKPHFEPAAHRPFPERAMFVDLKSYLPGDPLFLSDRMTMAHSLEARVPFVDREVMDLAARIPLSQKIQGRTTKLILRQALAGRVPDEIVRRPKRGFGTPIDLWLRGELSGFADQLLAPSLVRERGYFDPAYIQWLREQHRSGTRDFSQHLWALLMFELWHRSHIDRDLSAREGLSFEDLGLSASGYQAPGSRPAPAGEGPKPSSPNRTPGAPVRKLTILMVADVDPVHVIGGAERMLNEHCTRLAERGHRVVVLTRREDGKHPPEEEFRGVRVVRHPVGGGGPLGFILSVYREAGRAFARLHAEERFDLINIHQPLAGAAVLRRPDSRGLPVFYTYLSPWSDEYRVRASRRSRRGPASKTWVEINSRLRERIERGVCARTDRFLVLSDFTRTQLESIHGIPRKSPVIVPGGVDTSRFCPPADRAALRRELGLPEGPLLFTVRNLVPRMGLDALIDAMRKVVDARPEATLVIGGSGPQRAELEARTARLGLRRSIRFAGFIPEPLLPNYYGAADLFVLPTACLEGFGLVTVEALACGTPVLGTPVGGTREILTALDPDLLFADTSAGAMAERILQQLPELGPDFRARCREFVLEHYSWEAVMPRVEAMMLSLAETKAGR